jgi:hypothetical protein
MTVDRKVYSESAAMDNDYDWACRRLAKLAPVPLLCWLVTAFAQHLRFGHWLDTRTAALAGMPQSVRDTLAGLQELITHRWWTMLLEFQLQPDPEMFGRLMIYLGTAWLELRPDPLPGSRCQLAAAVVNLTGTSASLPASWDMTLPGPDEIRCCLKVHERYLQEEAALPLLHAIRTGEQGRILLPWIPLMLEDDVDEVISLWLEAWTNEPDDRLRLEYVALTRVFLELSVARERWPVALEGLDMIKSPFLESIRKGAREEGREEGETCGLAKAVVELLGLRLPGQIPTNLRTAIEQTRDRANLERWFKLAAMAKSLDEFRREGGL